MAAKPIRALFVAVTGIALAGLGLAAPAANAAPLQPGPDSGRLTNPHTGLPAGMTPLRNGTGHAKPQAPTTVAATPHLNYYGGPVVSNAKVYSVLWGHTTTTGKYAPGIAGGAAPNMDTFFGHVGNSAYMSWLNGEYNTGSQSIGYTSFSGRTTITPSAGASTSTIQDNTLRTELVNQIKAHHVPMTTFDARGDSTIVYALFFRSNTRICTPDGAGGTLCSGVDFCAYHDAIPFPVNGHTRYLLYMVLPDMSSANMLAGCGSATATTAFQATESAASHELVETITDPQVGLATSFGPPLAWYDDGTYGEIADICAAILSNPDGTVTGTDGLSYVVQQEWSNASSGCIVQKSTTTPQTAAAASAAPASGGRIAVSWTPPSDDGGTGISSYDIYQSTTNGVQGNLVATVAAPATSWVSGALGDGTQDYFEVVARNINGAGPASNQVTAVADAVAPTITVISPASLSPVFQVSTTMTVRYSGADSGSGLANFDVQYRSAPWNAGFGAYTTLASATGATSRTLAGSPGHEYCFHVRSRDHAGNVSAWSPDRCMVLPLDDRSLTTAGTWTRGTSTSYYRGTLTKTTHTGAYLKLANAHVSRIALVVTTCWNCGTIGVYLNGVLWHTVSTYSASPHYKVIKLPGSFSLRVTTIALKDLSKSTRQVIIDGLGIARS